jgi:hypothetical protein
MRRGRVWGVPPPSVWLVAGAVEVGSGERKAASGDPGWCRPGFVPLRAKLEATSLRLVL